MYAYCIKALQVLVDATQLPGGYQDLELRGTGVSSGSCPKLIYTQYSICLRAVLQEFGLPNNFMPTVSHPQKILYSHYKLLLGLYLAYF